MASLARIHPGEDIVEVDVKGRTCIAHAVRKDGSKLVIDPIFPTNWTYLRVGARQIRRHWRLTKNGLPPIPTDD